MNNNFSFSYSKMKNFDTCPKKHQEVDLLKRFNDGGEGMKWGNEVHAALANAVSGKDPLPDTMKQWQKWVDKYDDNAMTGTLLVEQQYAIKKDFQPTHYKDWNGAWLRVVVDYLRVAGPVARVVDWKTGKMVHESRQLMMSAQAVFAHHPLLQRILTEFVWLKEEYDTTTSEVFDRSTIMREWPPVLEKIKIMEDAKRLNNYPTNRSGLCFKYCPVTTCLYHGKRPNEYVPDPRNDETDE